MAGRRFGAARFWHAPLLYVLEEETDTRGNQEVNFGGGSSLRHDRITSVSESSRSSLQLAPQLFAPIQWEHRSR